jgi:hypothetical protein
LQKLKSRSFLRGLEKDFFLVSCLYSTIFGSSWFMDSGTSRHMTGTHDLFTSWSEMDSDLHVELGTNTKCGVKGVGIVRLYLELGGSLEVEYVLYSPELKMNFLLVSALEDKGFSFLFQNKQVIIHSKGSDP